VRLTGQTEQAQIGLNRSQTGLPEASSSVPPVFGRTPNAGLKISGTAMTGVGTTEVTKERQAHKHNSNQ